jgi:hypothetical protein
MGLGIVSRVQEMTDEEFEKAQAKLTKEGGGKKGAKQ